MATQKQITDLQNYAVELSAQGREQAAREVLALLADLYKVGQ